MKRMLVMVAVIFLMATADTKATIVAPMLAQPTPVPSCVIPCYQCEADMNQIVAFYVVEYGDYNYCTSHLAAITHCLRFCPQCSICADWITDYVVYGCDPVAAK